MVKQSSGVVFLAALLGFWMAVLAAPAYAQRSAGPVGDTLKISGKRVVFYSISPAEYNRLSTSESEEMNEVLSDFQLYVSQTAKWLRTVKIPIDATAASVVRCEYDGDRVWYFNRSKDTIQVGMILADGTRAPSLYPGVDTDAGWKAQIKLFYQLK